MTEYVFEFVKPWHPLQPSCSTGLSFSRSDSADIANGTNESKFTAGPVKGTLDYLLGRFYDFGNRAQVGANRGCVQVLLAR